ncbi:MAG: SLBB domain-containing protein [Verrucomicrobiota bacterium]
MDLHGWSGLTQQQGDDTAARQDGLAANHGLLPKQLPGKARPVQHPDMKTLVLCAVACWLLIIDVSAVRAELIFVGTWNHGGEVSYQFVDSQTARPLAGRIGSTMREYTLLSHDADTDELRLAKDGEELVLRRHQPAWDAEFAARMSEIEARQNQGAISREEADAERRAAGGSLVIVIGAVSAPGPYWFQRPCTLGEALIGARGFTRLALPKRIKVTRRDPQTGENQTFQVDMEKLDEQGNRPGMTFPLLPDDVVYVPEIVC